MAVTSFKYASISDLSNYFNKMGDFDSKIQIFPTLTSGNLHLFRDCGYVDTLFINGEEQAAAQGTSGAVDSNGEWFYNSATNQVEYYNSNYSSTTIHNQIFEAGKDFTDYLNQQLVNASMELNNLLDSRYPTPLPKNTQISESAASGLTVEYDALIIKATCYICASNLIRSKDPMSEEADYYYSLVTNPERTGLIDKLNDGIYKLSHEVDANDKKGKILRRSTNSTGDLVELAGEYHGEHYDLLKVDIGTGGGYGTATFTVSYLSNDQLEGAVTSAETITGGLQHIFNGLYGRFQGNQFHVNDYWYIEVYGSHMKQTNKSNATIEMVR